ncbi:MAG: hypothetical protein E7523_10090 [Ruminococcaceae bacterium]|nr:hypothetical protein [Oscillospiraceae bacterium]
MKYYYSKISTIAQVVVMLGTVMCAYFLGQFLFPDRGTVLQITIGSGVVIVYLIYLFIPGLLKRTVELYEDEVYFHSFIANTSKQANKTISIRVNYSQIKKLKARVLPFFGITSIVVRFYDTDEKIKLTPYFNNSDALFSTLCEKVRQNNPNADIDPKLIDYAERKKTK